MVDRRPQGLASELWSAEIATGKSDPVVSEAGLFGFDVSPDGRNVVYSVGTQDGARSLWLARVDHLVPPRQLTTTGNDLSPVFTPDGDLVFMSHDGDESYLYKMKPDGSERLLIDAPPVIQLETVSPDGRWAVAQAPIRNEDVPRGILAIPLEGGTPIRICSGLCVVRWPRNGKLMFLSVIGGSQGTDAGFGQEYSTARTRSGISQTAAEGSGVNGGRDGTARSKIHRQFCTARRERSGLCIQSDHGTSQSIPNSASVKGKCSRMVSLNV